jgi:hypothetical protein
VLGGQVDGRPDPCSSIGVPLLAYETCASARPSSVRRQEGAFCFSPSCSREREARVCLWRRPCAVETRVDAQLFSYFHCIWLCLSSGVEL